jgi:hexosaminidase
MSHCPLPSEPLDPTNPNVYDFVKTVYMDLVDLFPDDFVHVGGDEVNFDCWKKSDKISKWMKEHNMTDTVELYEYFETRLLRIVDTVGKTPIVWQEVFNLNLTIPENAIVDVWKGFDKKTIEQATNQSFHVILSGCWYLDHLNTNWETFYECYPRDFNGTTELMIGGHASMWGEHVDASNFISRTWPRASAAAERLWTGDVSMGAATTIKERIHKFRCRMVQQGFAAGPTGPGFCPHEVPYQQDDPGGEKHCLSSMENDSVSN